MCTVGPGDLNNVENAVRVGTYQEYCFGASDSSFSSVGGLLDLENKQPMLSKVTSNARSGKIRGQSWIMRQFKMTPPLQFWVDSRL